MQGCFDREQLTFRSVLFFGLWLVFNDYDLGNGHIDTIASEIE
jgi:hypothetical protein